MARFLKNRKQSQGKAPGSLIFLGRKKMSEVAIHVMSYNEKEMIEVDAKNIHEALQLVSNMHVSWINIYGLHDIELLKKLGDYFNLGTLLQEDMLNTDQQPKYIQDKTYDAFILKLLEYDQASKIVRADQLSMIVGKNILVTVQESTATHFNAVRERLRNGIGRIRSKGADYLAYALIDTAVDNYIHLTEKIGVSIEENEKLIFNTNKRNLAENIYKNKTELSFLRKNVRPVKDIVAQLLKQDSVVFEKVNKQNLLDLNDLIIQACDSIELYSSIASDQISIYSTTVGNRMNEIMKTLTIFSTMFIPLSFLAGVYGMNFDFLPELHFKYSYAFFWLACISLVISLLVFFKRRGWW